MNLLTIADGFGDSNATPPWYRNYIKWPELVQQMAANVNLTNLSRYGAGNEYMTECLRAHIDSADVILFQWTQVNRLDLLLKHAPDIKTFWQEQIDKDPVYNENVLSIKNNSYWISSASKNEFVQEYHNKFISYQQHQNRTKMYIDYATMLLEKKNKSFKFLLTYCLPFLKDMDINNNNWLWHQEYRGMENFRYYSKYADVDLKTYVQPCPLIHFDFIKQYIMPRVDLEWYSTEQLGKIENTLYNSHKEAMKNKPI